jgi:hypothetical protein
MIPDTREMRWSKCPFIKGLRTVLILMIHMISQDRTPSFSLRDVDQVVI